MSKRARLFIDYETYFDDDYTLKKMPTAQYLRDERFELLGAAMAAPGYIEPGWYTPGNGLGRALASLPWPNVEIIAHNVTFDAAVLATHAPQFRPAYHTCTLMRTRYAISQGTLPADRGTALAELGNKGDTADAVAAGGEKLQAYALQDLRDLMTLYVESEGWQIPRMELDLMDLHARMACYPVLSLRRELLEEVAAREPSDMVKQVRKKKVFLAMLEQLGVEPGMKESPRTGKTTYAFAKTDRFMRELATHRDPRVRLLHQLRTEGGSNIDRTRAQRFLDIGEPLPVPLLYYAAHTGRAGGCLVADTKVTVYDPEQGVRDKRITDVLPDDLVWDGEAFVEHEGVQFSGYKEVVDHEGVVGTPEHLVFTDRGTMALAEARASGTHITTAPPAPRDWHPLTGARAGGEG